VDELTLYLARLDSSGELHPSLSDLDKRLRLPILCGGELFTEKGVRTSPVESLGP
jgi:hypothetical protein